MRAKHRDLALVLVGSLALLVLFPALDLVDRYHEASRRYEAWQLDEIVPSLLGILVLLAWYGWRRTLRSSERSYRALYENASDAILVLRPRDEVVLQANPRADEMYGYAAGGLVGVSMADLSLQPERGPEQVASTLHAGDGAHSFLTRQRRRDGRTLEVAVNASVIEHGGEMAILSLNRDVTELMQMRDRLVQTEKLEALGRLAAGVAHDFNNLLTVIGGTASLLRLREDLDRATIEDLAVIQDATGQATQLTRQLLTFSRREPAFPRPIDLAEAVEASVGVLRRLLPAAVRVHFRRSGHAPTVLLDPTQLHQVLANLAINASDAMPGGGHLDLTIEAPSETRPHVRLIVQDTGTGMTQEEKRRAFEPFFTTKPAGRGTGLGLATVYGIVTQAGGSVEIESELGKGTSFIVSLPPADGEAEAVPVEPDETPEPEEAWTLPAGRTVLAVSDSRSLRRLIYRILRDHGTLVLEANDALDALHLLRSDLPIALLLTDIGLPGIDGRRLAEMAAGLRNDLVVRYVTGHRREEVADLPTSEVLIKPFDREQLVRFVAEALTGQESVRPRLG